MEADLQRLNLFLNIKRLSAEAIFACRAFAFYNGASPDQAFTGRRTACLPDLNILDHPGKEETSGYERERLLARRPSLGRQRRPKLFVLSARRPRQKGHACPPGDLFDYRRPAATKDDHGSWSWQYAIVRNEPERGQVIVKMGSREPLAQCPDVRHAGYVEALFAREIAMGNMATVAVT